MSGFEAALKAGRGRDDSWSTSSALVSEALGRDGFAVGWLDDFLAPGVPDAIGFTALDAVAALGPLFEDAGQKAGLPSIMYYMAMPLQRALSSLMYKQAVLESWLAKTKEPRLVVGNPVLTPPVGAAFGIDRFDTLFAVFASRMSGVEVLQEPTSDRSALYGRIDGMTRTDRFLSLFDFSLPQLTYRVLRYLGLGKTFRLGRKGPTVHVLNDNELIREALPWLILEGAGVCMEKQIPTQKPEDSPLPGLPGEDDIAEKVKQAAKAHGLDQDFGLAVSIVAERLAYASCYWRPSFRAAQKRVASWGGAGAQVLVLSLASGVSHAAMVAASKQAGIPVVVVEHGVSGGLSKFHEPIRPFSEASWADLFLVCSPNAVRFNDEDETLKGKSVAVGLAQQVRRPPGWIRSLFHRKRLTRGGR